MTGFLYSEKTALLAYLAFFLLTAIVCQTVLKEIEMDKQHLLTSVGQICDISSDILRVADANILTFMRGRARVTIRILFNDEQSGADLVITNMTTLPDTEKNLGNGSAALQEMLRLAQRAGFQNIIATQVQTPSENFWKQNKFVKTNNVTNDFQYAPTHDANGKRLS